MNVSIQLYRNLSDSHTVHKKMSLIKTCSCQITESVDVDELDIELDFDSNLTTCNYAKIEAFSRYYFVTPSIKNGNQQVMRLISDPLTSFWNSLSQSQCIAERSTSHGNPNLEDNMLPFKPRPHYIRRTVGRGFTPSSSGGCYILTVGGK